jgi:hypothetical protein
MAIKLVEKVAWLNESLPHLQFRQEMSSLSFREMREAMEQVAPISIPVELVLVEL